MDWNKTKTIFIIVFLILNVFLVSQYLKKMETNEFEMYAEASFEERLKENEIEYITLPKQTSNEQYLTAKSKEFKTEDLKKLKNQTVININENKIISTFDDPFLLGDMLHSEALDTFVKENILYGENYTFWEVDELSNVIIYYQTYNNRVIYNNDNAKIVLFLNENHEITSYEQMYLDNIEQFNEEKEVYSAMKTLESLFNKGYLPSKSKITEVKLGYYNLIQLSSSYVLTPTWQITINDKENIFVNAFDGQKIETDDVVNETEEKILE